MYLDSRLNLIHHQKTYCQNPLRSRPCSMFRQHKRHIRECTVSNGTVYVSMCSHDSKNAGELVPRNMYQWKGLLHREGWYSPRRVMQRLGTTVCAREFRNIGRSNRFQMTDYSGRWKLVDFFKTTFSSFAASDKLASLSTMYLDFLLYYDGLSVISNCSKHYRFRVAIVT